MIMKVMEYLQYPFVQHAVIVSILIALCASLLGVILVLKRLSFIGDGLSHVAFGTMAVSMVLGFTNEMIIVLPGTMLVAILLLCSGKKAKIKGDAAIAMLSVGALAVGYLIMNLFPTSASGGNIAGDVCSTLFGSTSLLSISGSDVWICIALSVLVILLYVFFYHRIFANTFDENFAKATGTKTSLYNMLIAGLTAVTIVIGMRMMGALLISSLIIFPTVTSMRLCKSFKRVVIVSSAVSVFCFISGLIISIIFEIPTGASVVCFNIFVLLVFSVFKYILEKDFKGKKGVRNILLAVSAVLFYSLYLVLLNSGSVNAFRKDKKTLVKY
ncbi:MAG: metal ABC transporter permease, partial [Lachnospiraceae bacterium]|nr:metal ABC transporter permease [Lachnospiraceae bacterium]